MHRSIESILNDARESGRSLPQVVLETEARETGVAADAIRARVRRTLRVMRDAIDKYHGDTGHYPDSLDALVSAHYLRSLPVDPITERADSWQIVAPSGDEAGAMYDIKSSAPGTAHDGSAYADW